MICGSRQTRLAGHTASGPQSRLLRVRAVRAARARVAKPVCVLLPAAGSGFRVVVSERIIPKALGQIRRPEGRVHQRLSALHPARTAVAAADPQLGIKFDLTEA